MQGIHRWPVNSPYKWPVTRKTFPFDETTVPDFVECISLKPQAYFLCSKLFGIVYTCSCAMSWSFTHLPHTGLPMAQNLLNLIPIVSRFCLMQISETSGQIFSIQRSIKLSRLVVGQYHDHLPPVGMPIDQILVHTVKCHYNAVQFITIIHMALQ